MIDYSYQQGQGRRGTHGETIDVAHFVDFLNSTGSHDFDVMLEIKDKEQSALKAVKAAKGDRRFISPP